MNEINRKGFEVIPIYGEENNEKYFRWLEGDCL